MAEKFFGRAAIIFLFIAFSTSSWAGEADVVNVATHKMGDKYSFDVTIKSHDKGWDYYADSFEVIGPDGKILGTRVLLHPHEEEQPFTRELLDVYIPAGIARVTIRAHHKVAGYDGGVATVELPR
jgi:hypothetical protein